MNLNEIYELIAQQVENGLNAISTVVKFDLKTSYNVQKPQISKNTKEIYGIISFSNNDIEPIENIENYTFPAAISFYCVKELGNEVQAIINAYIASNKGIIQAIGDYTTIPTYSTCSTSGIFLLGQEGEALQITFFADFPVFSGVLCANQITYTLDGVPLPIVKYDTGKSKATNSDNLENTTTLSNVPISQSIAFSFIIYITTSLNFILQEIYSTEDLATTHTLVANVDGTEYTYIVTMPNGAVTGIAGNVITASVNFAIYDGGSGQ